MINLLFLLNLVAAQPLKIAVLDTGYDSSLVGRDVNLCKQGHAEFVEGKKLDFKYPFKEGAKSKHGTNVAFLIDEQLSSIPKSEYCIVIIKVFDLLAAKKDHQVNTVAAFKYAKNIKVHMVNYSAGGEDFDQEEKDAVMGLIDSDIVLVTAAGNEKTILEKSPCDKGLVKECDEAKIKNHRYGNYYPAMYDSRIVVVGAVDKNKEIRAYSNRGAPVDYYELGEDLYGGGVTLSGTSQATARYTGKIARTLAKLMIELKEKKAQEKKNAKSKRANRGN